MQNNEKYYELSISPFNIPFLRDLGIKTVALITFDIIYGPVCYIKELSKTVFGNRLKKVDSLAEIYAGFARTDVDVITSLDEKIVLSSYTVKNEQVDTTSILLFICISDADTKTLTNYCRSLNERAKGKPEKLNDALKTIIEERKKSAHKILVETTNNKIKGLTINNETFLMGNEFNNFYGFVLIDYNRSDIDARFIPKIIKEKKVDIKPLVKFVDTQKNEAELSPGELISLYYRGLELLIFTHSSTSILVGVKKSRSQINYNYINKWFNHFIETYINTPGFPPANSTLETLKYLDQGISGEPKRFIISELFELMINAERTYPELNVLPTMVKQYGWVTLHTNYELLIDNLHFFNGNFSIYTIARDLSIPVSKVIEFVIFLKSRELMEVYRKK